MAKKEQEQQQQQQPDCLDTYANGHSRFWFWYFKQLKPKLDSTPDSQFPVPFSLLPVLVAQFLALSWV